MCTRLLDNVVTDLRLKRWT